MEIIIRKEEEMKRPDIILTVVFALLPFYCSTVWSRPTTAYEAQQAARGWLRIDSQPLDTVLGRQVAKVETFSDKNGEPIYYIIYLHPAGFLIMPANDLVEPIVGFADDGKYDPSPDNCLGALVNNDLKGRIAIVRNAKSLEAPGRMEKALKSQAKWSRFISLADSLEDDVVIQGLGLISDVRVPPLVQSRWSQLGVCGENCYNYYTPYNYHCGCVATAIAQLIRYHKYPNDGPERRECWYEVKDVEEKAFPLGGDGYGGPYNWSQMPLVPDCSLTTAQREAIGALCFDAGISSGTNYKEDGSEAAFYAMTPLKYVFKYSNTIMGEFDNQNIEGLVGMFNPNLDGKHPVILGITGDVGGHAVVCDGYGYHSSTMYHHINMGWAGSYDAWYNLPNIDSSPPFNSVIKCYYNIFTTGSGEVISGRVLEANGDPIPNATVFADTNEQPAGSTGGLDFSSGDSTVFTSTDSSGIYAFIALNSNTTYGITAFAGGCMFSSQKVVVTGTSQSYQSTSGNVWGIDFVLTRFDCLHVDDNAPGDPGPGDPTVSDRWEDGSMEHPLDSIQEAIDAAVNGNTIEVAPGTYNEAINFKGKAVRLYSSGGPEVTTIDGTGLNTSVVTCERSEGPDTVLEGFTITGGNAENGAGMFNNGSSPTVTNCTFSGNTGGVYGVGGGMCNNNSSPTVTNCMFNGNSAHQYGGGMCNNGSNPTVTKCTFTGNDSSRGGGMCNYNNSSPTVTNCTFTGNSNCEGPGMCNYSSSPTVTNCLFSGNTGDYGGGMYNLNSSPTVINCTFSSNSATYNGFNGGYGGGMFNYEFTSPTVINCTFSGNTADFGGGGICNNESNPTLVNCILWGDTPNEILDYDFPTSTTTASFSDVQGGWPGTDNINDDPCFVDAAVDNFRLASDSPCIDAGDTTAVPTGVLVDVDGNIRGVNDPQTPDSGVSILGVTVDMGAYEFRLCRIPGDNNCDGMVDFKDMVILCDNWLAGIESQ
jgi:hypothetical protein